MKISITGIQIQFESRDEFIEFVNALKQKAEQYGLELVLAEKQKKGHEEKKEEKEKKIVVV